jgi:hypothetical protein
MVQPATKSFAAKLSWKSINLISFHYVQRKEKLDSKYGSHR